MYKVDSPLGMFSRHPLSTLATVSATLPVVLSSRPSGTTTEGGHLLDNKSVWCEKMDWFNFPCVQIYSPGFKAKYLIWVAVRESSLNLHSLLLLQLPRLPLTIRRMVSRAVEDWLSVAGATGLSADGGSRLPFWGGKRWRQKLQSVSLDHPSPQWLSDHPQIQSGWLKRVEISALIRSEMALSIKFVRVRVTHWIFYNNVSQIPSPTSCRH